MSNQEPSFTAYAVTKRDGQEDWWTALGAAFVHQDGQGYNIILAAVPVNGKIVLRAPKSQPDTTDASTHRENVRDIRQRRREK
jgi:hypothetical protein